MNKPNPIQPPKKPNLAVRKPGPENGYIPSYTPENDDAPQPKPVEKRVDTPTMSTAVSLSELTERIIDNASILHPGVPLKLVTAKCAGSGCSYNALVASPKNPERPTSRWQVEVKGSMVNMAKGHEHQARRRAVEVLLGELERKVAKELLEK